MEDFAYCGLNCKTCKKKFAIIREKIKSLNDEFEKVKFLQLRDQTKEQKWNIK